MYSFSEDAHGHLVGEVPKVSTVAAPVSRWWYGLVKEWGGESLETMWVLLRLQLPVPWT